MTELLTAAQMRAIEQAAIDSGEVTGLELMERAGAGVVEAIFEEWPELAKTDHRAVVLCGPGNNGGDGFVVARLLKEWGWEVEVFLYGDEGKLPADAKANCERWREMGEVASLELFQINDYETTSLDAAGKTWIIDAIFGTGLTRNIKGDLARVIKSIARTPLGQRPAVISIDIPSGICSDSGRVFRCSMPTELMITFHLPKIGHYIGGEHNQYANLVLKDIGLPSRYPHSLNSSNLTISNTAEDYLSLDKSLTPKFKRAEHKHSHGHAVILSGGIGKTGAARLTARGALRVGAGLVTVVCPPDAQLECASHLTSIMLDTCADADDFIWPLEDHRVRAICIGPGFGLGEEDEIMGAKARRFVVHMTRSNKPLVLDADVLRAFSSPFAQKKKRDDPDTLFALLHENCILTPHAGEFKALFPDIVKKLNTYLEKGPAYSKVDATRAAAKRAGCVVLFKGADTVIAAPDGQCAINSAHYERAAPWLATAGSGDVLAGFITGLLARGFSPMQAAETAAWLHVECALKFGPGLIAEDLPEQLPKVFQDLGL